MDRFYTAESVTEGHPDKLCDQIADSVLDDCLAHDPLSRVACEVLATRNHIVVAGEITSHHVPRVPAIIESLMHDIGYSTRGLTIDLLLHRQSPDIAAGSPHPRADTCVPQVPADSYVRLNKLFCLPLLSSSIRHVSHFVFVYNCIQEYN